MKPKTTTWFSVYMDYEDNDEPPRLIAGFRLRSEAEEYAAKQRRDHRDFDDAYYFIRKEEVTTT